MERFRLYVMGAVLMMAASSAEARSGGQGFDSLAPRLGEPFQVELTRGGRAVRRILVPATPDAREIRAAELLREALKAGTGCEFPITQESEYRGGAVFSLGRTALYTASGLTPGVDLERDGYWIGSRDGNVFLLGGRRRGALSPVIALIEEDLGGRWYARDEGLTMPRLAARVTVSGRAYVPRFRIRTMFQSESFDEGFQLFNRVGSSTQQNDHVRAAWGGTTAFPKKFFVHTMERLLPNEQYFQSHPEYFALIDGKRVPQGHGGGGGHLCMTHPDVRRIVTERVLSELARHPECELFDVSINDASHGFCQCSACQALARREGSESGPLIDFVNAVARGVKPQFPDVKITTLAYLEANTPPRTLRPADNVLIRLCNDTASFPYPMFFLEESDQFYPHMKGWIDRGAQLFIWDYVVNYKAWPQPWPNLAVIDHNIDTYAANGVYGLFLQSSHYGPGENQGRLRAWVYAKKMWDPSRRIRDLVRDFNHGYYGAAGDLMQAYSDLLFEEWKSFHDTHSFRDAFAFSPAFYPRARSLFDQALARAAGDPRLLSRIELEFISVLFYRLQFMPPEGDADREQYAADLARFQDLTSRHQVEWIDEGVTRTEQRITEWRRKYHIPSQVPEVPVPLLLTPDNITRCADGGARVEDISAPGGQYIEMPVLGNGWSLQWFFGSALLEGVEYSVRIQLRADRKRPSGDAIGYGIYSITRRREPMKGVLDAADIPQTGFAWLDLGTVNGSDTESAYFYVAQIPDSAVSRVYITAIEIRPHGR